MAEINQSPDTFPDKHPDAKRPYTVDWVDDLGESETIASSVWEIDGDDSILVKSNEGIDPNGKEAVVWLEGGTLGAQYLVANKIVTNSTPPRHLATEKFINIRRVN